MKIAYIAKHNSGGNDDEGAITHALESLGHEVIKIQEKGIRHYLNNASMPLDTDFVLFHHWNTLYTVPSLKNFLCPKVFWCFDLFDYPDKTLQPRNFLRTKWAEEILPHVDLGFCTDGDFVNKDTSGKLIRLTQGADIRLMKKSISEKIKTPPILFTGISKGGGIRRQEFVEEMKEVYGSDFNHVVKNMHGRRLSTLIQSSKIVVAPIEPATDHYWSNRVYLTLGAGGFLLHPYCKTLADQYEDEKEIGFYSNMNHLHTLINYYLQDATQHERIETRLNARKRTRAENTYTNRCETLINHVKERIL